MRITRKFLATLAAVLVLVGWFGAPSPARAQTQTRAQLLTNLTSCWPTNGMGLITAASVRACQTTLINSITALFGDANVIANSVLNQAPAHTTKCNPTGSTANVQDCLGFTNGPPLTYTGGGSTGSFTPSNNGVFVNDTNGNELLRIFASGPNGGAGNFGSDNLYFGWQSGNANPSDNLTAGYFNTGLGYQTLRFNTTGNNNVAVGISSQEFNTTGSLNQSLGVGTLEFNTTGTANTAMGYHALILVNGGSHNSGFGNNALAQLVSGNNTTAVGESALTNATSGNETALGFNACAGVTTGDTNLCVGYLAGNGITTGRANTIIGSQVPMSAAVSNQVVLADGDGNIVAQGNGVAATFAIPGTLKLNGQANGSVATAMSSLGPAGSHATIQEWFAIQNGSGVVRYIPAF